jgi:Holliday junction resolvase-like predicted endonuclease
MPVISNYGEIDLIKMEKLIVEWFVEEFFKYSRISNFHTGEQEEVITLRQFEKIVEQAKAMETLRISEIHYEAYMNALKGIMDEYNDNLNEK